MPHLIKALIGLLLFTLLFSCSFPKEPDNSKDKFPHNVTYILPPELEPKVDRINKLVEHQIKTGIFNGVVLVADYGNIIYLKANGYSNFKSKEKLNEHSTFQLASVSKMFTATAIMVLKNKGLLEFDDLVTKYIPLFPYETVTVRNLLNHRSGLPRYMVTSDEFWPRDTMMNNQEMHRLMVEHCPKPYYQPNTHFNYQNSNYAYLALIVEQISGTSFQTFCRDNIFEPLNMYDTKIFNGQDSLDIPGSVVGHIYRRPRPVDPYKNYINGVVGDKGVYSSVFDLLKFDQALYSNVFLPDSIVRQAYIGGSPKRPKHWDNYGFGWRIDPFKTDHLVFHYGWWNGFKACFMRFMDSRKTIIVLTNRDRSLTLPKRIKEILFEVEKSAK